MVDGLAGRTDEDLGVLDVGLDLSCPWYGPERATAAGQFIEGFIIVLGIGQCSQHELLQVAQTRCLPRLLACLGKDREENRRQDRDDRDHDQ